MYGSTRTLIVQERVLIVNSFGKRILTVGNNQRRQLLLITVISELSRSVGHRKVRLIDLLGLDLYLVFTDIIRLWIVVVATGGGRSLDGTRANILDGDDAVNGIDTGTVCRLARAVCNH